LRRNRSTAIRQLTSACDSAYSISRGVAHVFNPTDVAPSCCSAKKASTHSMRLPIRMATWSPRFTPNAASPLAVRRTSSRRLP
jgi:hypothetical protein